MTRGSVPEGQPPDDGSQSACDKTQGAREEAETLPLPQALLPHRYPFLLLDRIITHRLGHIEAIKCITYNEPFFAGHFPGEAIVPGVLLVEMMAQSCAALARLETEQTGSLPRPGRIAMIERARFRTEARPGDRLVIESSRTYQVGLMSRYESRILCEGRLIAEASLTLRSPHRD